MRNASRVMSSQGVLSAVPHLCFVGIVLMKFAAKQGERGFTRDFRPITLIDKQSAHVCKISI
jgi:hypothetical protein